MTLAQQLADVFHTVAIGASAGGTAGALIDAALAARRPAPAWPHLRSAAVWAALCALAIGTWR